MSEHSQKIKELQLLASSQPEKKFAVFQAVWNLLSSDTPLSDIIQVLVECLKNQNHPMLRLAAVIALGDIVKFSPDQTQQVVDAGAVPVLIQLLHSPAGSVRDEILLAALLNVAKIAGMSEANIQVVLSHGALSYLPALLSHPKEAIREAVVWVIASIAIGNQSQIQAVFNAGLLPKVFKQLREGELETQMPAVWVISDVALYGSHQQVFAMISEGVIPPFCALLACQDTTLIDSVLYGLNHILEMAGEHSKTVAIFIEGCEGLAKIKSLQSHGNEKISRLARKIIHEYFPDHIHTSRNQQQPQ
ncbi:importin subunit alpha-4-like [Drosophila miranda]|uniref:importin subunit alpha-4-like n=1 Tax=Drosophila miranda TaxID=7229 RepID=UPI0007E63B61|nr:importin subunit alpha-4-like [Drosophila miranda]